MANERGKRSLCDGERSTASASKLYLSCIRCTGNCSYACLTLLRRRHVKKYVSSAGDMESDMELPSNGTDLNNSNFNSELYLSQVLSQRSLSQVFVICSMLLHISTSLVRTSASCSTLFIFTVSISFQIMDIESDMTQQIRALDSDMRTLIYENYAKFINATDTIKQMKTDFKQMEEEMTQLSDNMANITNFRWGSHLKIMFSRKLGRLAVNLVEYAMAYVLMSSNHFRSGKISSRLEDRRERMNKLSSVHGLLQKLQFLMDLPTTLKEKIDNGEYGQAVRVYQKARRVLEAYKDMPSFRGSYGCLVEIRVGLEIRRVRYDADAFVDEVPKSE